MHSTEKSGLPDTPKSVDPRKIGKQIQSKPTWLKSARKCDIRCVTVFFKNVEFKDAHSTHFPTTFDACSEILCDRGGLKKAFKILWQNNH